MNRARYQAQDDDENDCQYRCEDVKRERYEDD